MKTKVNYAAFGNVKLNNNNNNMEKAMTTITLANGTVVSTNDPSLIAALLNAPAQPQTTVSVPANGSKKVESKTGLCYKLVHNVHRAADYSLDKSEKAADWVDTKGVMYACDGAAATTGKVSEYSKSLSGWFKAAADARR